MQTINTIRFQALAPQFDDQHQFQGMVPRRVVFALGVGPCGQHVDNLFYEVDDQFVTIRQVTQVETKTFMYRNADLIGRIEVKHI